MGAFFSHKIDAVQRLLLSNSISDWLIALTKSMVE